MVVPSDAQDKPSEILRNLNAVEEAERRAYERGRVNAKRDGQVASHERRLNAINGSLDRHTEEMRKLAEGFGQLGEAFRQSIAVAAARAKDAKEDAERQVSTRTFVLGLIGAVVAIGGLLAATGHA